MALLGALYRGCGCTGLIGLGLLIAGGQALYTVSTNRTPVKMTCAEYFEKKPEGKWLQLSECRLSRLEMFWMTSLAGQGPISKVYIPLRAPKSKEGDKIHLLMESREQADLDFAKEMKEAGESREKFAKFISANAGKAVETRDVEGTIQFGLELSDRDRDKLRKASNELDDDFAILDPRTRPEWGRSLGLVIGGVVFVGLRLLLQYREKAAPVA